MSHKELLRLLQECGEFAFRVDFGGLPGILGPGFGGKIGIGETYRFINHADNYDPLNGEAAELQLGSLHWLKEQFHYEVVLFPIDFAGRRLSIRDRDPSPTFKSKETRVGISPATDMLYFAAIPFAYDIAPAVIGVRDFKLVFQYVRRLGKRVTIASVKGSCSSDDSDSRDEARGRNLDINRINHHLSALKLKYEPHGLRPESPNHRGGPFVWKTYYPGNGERFYCDDCLAAYQAQQAEARREALGGETGGQEIVDFREEEKMEEGVTLNGAVIKLVADRGFGLLRSDAGEDYFFFHLSDPYGDLRINEPDLKDRFVSEIRQQPTIEEAGSAQKVRWIEDGRSPVSATVYLCVLVNRASITPKRNYESEPGMVFFGTIERNDRGWEKSSARFSRAPLLTKSARSPPALLLRCPVGTDCGWLVIEAKGRKPCYSDTEVLAFADHATLP